MDRTVAHALHLFINIGHRKTMQPMCNAAQSSAARHCRVLQ